MQKVLSFTSDVKEFPAGTVGVYTWSVNGAVVGTGETITFDFPVGSNAIALSLTDASGVELAPAVSASLILDAPATVQLSVPNYIVIADAVA